MTETWPAYSSRIKMMRPVPIRHEYVIRIPDDPSPAGAEFRQMILATSMNKYDTQVVWKFSGPDGPFPGIVLALHRLIEGLRLADLVGAFAALYGDVWRYFGALPYFPIVVLPLPDPEPWVESEPAHRATGARALYDRSRSRCVPLRGPNHVRASLSRVGVDMST